MMPGGQSGLPGLAHIHVWLLDGVQGEVEEHWGGFGFLLEAGVVSFKGRMKRMVHL